MQVNWDFLLIFLSVMVAVLGSFTALSHAQRMRASTGLLATLWMAAGSLTLGVAAWSTHFIGMLAFQLPIPIVYDLTLTILSVFPPIVTALLGFYMLREPIVSIWRIAMSGSLFGVGIGMMHYIGMAALQMTPKIVHDPLVFAISLAIAIVCASGALLIMYRGECVNLPTLPRFMSGATLMGLAILGMYYVAMLATNIQSGSSSIADTSQIQPKVLAALIVISALFWFVGGILASWFDQHMGRNNAQALAELERDHNELREHAAKQAEEITQSLRESEEQLRMTLRCAPDAVLICEDDGRIVYANHNFIDMLQYDRGELYAMAYTDLVSADWRDRYQLEVEKILADGKRHVFEIVLIKKGGGNVPIELYAVMLPNGRLYGSCRDISERKLAEHKIHQLAFYDALTSLPNRRLLMDRLHQALTVSMRSAQYGAVMFLDIDHFKIINDTKGHDIGDMLLLEVAKRLEFCLRDGDTVARIGGDEFVVVLAGLGIESTEAATQAEFVAEKIRAALNHPYRLVNYIYHTTSSIGIVLFKGHGESIEELLKHADAAMYQAKTAGRNAIRFYDPAMQASIEARVDLGEELHRAVENQQFRLHFQVQVDSLRYPVGAEVLLRWEHPERGLIYPEHFISLAEDVGLIGPIGLWVLQTVCAQLKIWQKDELTRDLKLSVNVSAKQFHQTDFVSEVQRVLLESGARPALLKLELTESTALENIEDAITKMHELKPLGLGFSMDDFGTGHSSLQYLKRLPLDQIKIDQSFVRDIATDPNDAAIVQTIIAMTEALGLEVIAEGVETEAQHEFLDLRGCRAFQGFLFGRPMPIEHFEMMLGAIDGVGRSDVSELM